MKKKFLTNLLLLLILNLLIKPFWIFGIDRTVQNITGTGEYGFYFSLFNFSLLFNIFLDLGITNFNNRSISGDKTLFSEYFPNLMAAKTALAFLYAAFTLTISFLMGYSYQQIHLLLFLILNQFISSLILFFRSNISGLQFYTTDSMLSVLDRALMIILCSIVIWGKIFQQAFRIEYFVYIQTVSYSVTAFVVFLVLKRKAGKIKFRFDPKMLLGLCIKLLPFALLGFLMTFYNRIDSILLERLLPKGQVEAGIYAQSFRILDAASNFSVLFAGLLLPMFSGMIPNKQDVFPLLKTSFVLIFVASIAFTFTCFALREPLMRVLYSHANSYSISVFSILIFSFIPISFSYIFGTLLTANGNLKHLNYIALAGVVFNLGLNLILIPHLKAAGSAIASLVTQTGLAVAQIIAFSVIWKIRLGWNEVLPYLLFLILASSFTIVSVRIDAPMLIKFVGLVAVICLSGFLTGLLPVKNFFKHIRLEMN